jgi:putative drug exporter of the RND superfamily
MKHGKLNTFGKLGRLITKRKWAVIAVWILMLAIILPVVLTATGYTSNTLMSSSDSSSESSEASHIINTQFQTAVSNDSLLLIISTDNASSLETQQFIDELITKIKADPSITGVENVTSIYTVLVSALNQTNQGVYLAYNNGNLTYNLFYSVPMAYSKVWSVAYDTALNDNLIPGFNQTNQGVYALIPNVNQTFQLLYSVPTIYSTVYSTAYNQTRDTVIAPSINQTNQGVYSTIQNANDTYNMLYSTPAIYLNAWAQAYTATGDVATANAMANKTTAETLYAADAASYAMYTSHILELFNNYWTASQADPSTAIWAPDYRASYASNQTNQYFINNLLAGNQTEQAFVTALTNTMSLQDFLANNQTQTNAKLTAFAIQTVGAASNGQASLQFVQAAYNLGKNPSINALNYLAEDIIQHPTTYNMGTDFISTFNQVAYNQTRDILYAADPLSFAQYSGPLLSAFNTTWTMSFQNPALQSYTVMQRAALVSNMTNQAFVSQAFAGNQTAMDFATQLINNFTLSDFIFNSQDTNNANIVNFAINYVADQGDIPADFVRAAYNLGQLPSSNAVTTLAKNVIWNPNTYGMYDQNFIGTFNQVAYNQTKSILKDVDEEAFNKYTSHLLDYFNTEWVTRVPTIPTENWINSTAAKVGQIADQEFINNYFSDNADFANSVAQTFTLQDYLEANTTLTNAKLQGFAISYVSNQSGLSQNLIKATFDLGENASKTALQTLASNIVTNPTAYNVGDALTSAIDSFISSNSKMTIVSISLDQGNTTESNVPNLRNLISNYIAENPDGIQSIKVTGEDAITYDYSKSTSADLDLILPVTIVLLVAATAIFFRSIVTPIITLGTIGVGLGVSYLFPYLVGTFIDPVDYNIITVLLTVLIGVGTDYTIFIIARHREERINGLPLKEAIKKSIIWAGESIVTSGTTVIISFLALSFTSMVFLQTMGVIIGLGVIVTLLAALTFTPALVAILGDRIFWPNSGERFQKYADGILRKNKNQNGYFAKSGHFSVKHSKAIILLAIVITLPSLYVYATTVQTYNFIGSASNSLESISGYNSLTDTFGSGRMLPSYVVVTFSEPIVYNNGSFNQAELETLNQISNYVAYHEGIQEVTGPTMPYGSAVNYKIITNNSDPVNYSGIISTISKDNQTALITVKFTVDPYSTQAMDYAQDIRTTLHNTYDNTSNITGIYVGGTTGSILDVKNTFMHEFDQIIPIVTVCVIIVLFIVLGSITLPIFAVLSVFMSIFWTLAVTILVFQSAFNYGLLFIAPLILLVLLLGIGMDYNIFILTRVREEAAKGQSLKDAIVNAIEQTGGIITAAAIILAGSLGSLMLSSNVMLKELGFAFAFSILIDALIVRTYLVPAVMSVMGKWNWYNPIKRLSRVKNEDTEATEATPKETPKKQKDQ